MGREMGSFGSLKFQYPISFLCSTFRDLRNLNATQRKVLIEIQEYRREEGMGTGKRDMVRAGNDGTTGRKPKAARQSTPGKRLARRASEQKSKSLLRR